MFGHFLAGAAQAGLDNYDAAIMHLQAAADAGYDELAELRTRDTLAPLKARPEWRAIEDKIEANLG